MKNQKFYTQNGYAGSNYDSKLTPKDIATNVRNYIKKAHPDYRFSVKSRNNSIDIAMIECPVELTNYELMKAHIESSTKEKFYIPSLNGCYSSTQITNEQKEEHIQWVLNKDAYCQLSPYALDTYQWINPIILEVLKDINTVIDSYLFDDSDAMVDYFDTNFYKHINIGEFDKPARFVEHVKKTA